ncbi:MAG: phenylacetate--CoA ligase family protein [Thermodesulfobacteriota bacterium]
MSLQAALVSGLLQPAYERLRGRITPRLERELEASQWWPADRLANLQWRELARLLDHARRRVPFYRQWFADQGVEPADLIARRDISPLPIVTRAQLMAAPERFWAENPPTGSYMKATGGSSGRPLRFRLDPRSDQWRLAMSRRGYAWAGCRPGERQVYLWSSDFTPPGRLALAKRGLHRLLQGQIYIDSFHLGPAELDRALGLIGRFRPRCLVAFTSAALILARWALKRRWRPPASLASVITGAEGLSQPDRELLERVFACPVFETYGSREFMLTAAECPAHAGLHISSENLLLEVVDPAGRPCAPGQTGRVLVTDLHNYAQPFIRYQNDDLAAWAGGECACGRGLPLLARIDGRLLDVLRSPGGRELTGTLFPHLIKDFEAITAYQAVQDRLDHLSLRLVLARPLSDRERQGLLAAVGGALPGVTIDLTPVEQIERTPGGKIRVTIGLPPEAPA